jgi:hypothetical protein
MFGFGFGCVSLVRKKSEQIVLVQQHHRTILCSVRSSMCVIIGGVSFLYRGRFEENLHPEVNVLEFGPQTEPHLDVTSAHLARTDSGPSAH